jgi:hypothetical protein
MHVVMVIMLVVACAFSPAWANGPKQQESIFPTQMIIGGDVIRLDSHQRLVYSLIRAYFSDRPEIVRVAACESGLRHFTPEGEVVIGKITPDVGVFQINPIHHRTMVSQGLDPKNLVHNLAYAAVLIRERPNLNHWNSSRHCWSDPDRVRFVYPVHTM